MALPLPNKEWVEGETLVQNSLDACVTYIKNCLLLLFIFEMDFEFGTGETTML